MPGMSPPEAPLRRIRGRRPGRRSGTARSRRPAPPAPAGPHRTWPAMHVHPGGEHVFQQAVGQEVAVGQQQVPRGELAQQLAGQQLLPVARPEVAAPSTARVPHSPSPTTRICGNGPRPVVARVPELRPVLLVVRQVQAHPVHGRQPHPGHERGLLLLPRQRPGRLLQQPLHHLPAQPLPGQVIAAGVAACPAPAASGTGAPSPGPPPACSTPRRNQTGRTAPSPGRSTPPPAGSVRLRCSRTPAWPMTRSTSSGVNTFVSTPIPIRSASRSPATTCCPGLATKAILHRWKA